MQSIKLTWTDFKAKVIANKLSVGYYERDILYKIFAFDGNVKYKCDIEIEDPASSDQTDFETNYKTTANSKYRGIETKAVKNPDGKRARLIGTHYATAAASTTTNADWQIPQLQYPAGTNSDSIFDGIQYYAKDAHMGDKLHFQVVDVDNILGYGAGLVVEEFGKDWYIAPNSLEDIILYKAKLIPGLYIRAAYTNTGGAAVEFFCNLYRHLDP